MNAVKRKAFAMALCLAIAMVFSVTAGTGQAAAGTATMRMPTKITTYELQDNKWKKVGTTTYKYNKYSDLVKYTDSQSGTIKVKYKYKGKKKVSATARNKHVRKSFKFNRSGLLTYAKTRNLDKKYTYTDTYLYDKKGYLTSVKWTDGYKGYSNHKGTDRYTTTFLDDSTTSIMITGKDFYGKKQTNYLLLDKDGLLVQSTYDSYDYSYEYTRNGRYVKERIETIDFNDGTSAIYRNVYQYGKTRAPAATYFQYINEDDRALATNL